MNTLPSNDLQLPLSDTSLSEPDTKRPDNSASASRALEEGDRDVSPPVVYRHPIVTVNTDSDCVSTIQMREMMRHFSEGSHKVLLDKVRWGSPTDPSVLDQIIHNYGGDEVLRFEVTDTVVDGDLHKTLWVEFVIKDHATDHPVVQAVLFGIPFKLGLYTIDMTAATTDPHHPTQTQRHRSLDYYVILADYDQSSHTYRTRFEGPDEDGWYTGVVGAVCHGKYNLNLQSVKKTLENPESKVYQRLAGEGLFGEWGSIGFNQYESLDDAMVRVATIDPKNLALQIGQLWLDESYGQTLPEVYNQDMVAIMGKVRPFGPFADMAEQVLNGTTPGRVTFRALTDTGEVSPPNTNRPREHHLVDLVTFDIKPITLD